MFKKRVLSFLMACCMTLTFLPPPTALADDDGVDAPTDNETVMVELSDDEETPVDTDAAQEAEDTPVDADAAQEAEETLDDADAAQEAEETPVDADAAQETEETPDDADAAQEAEETLDDADAAQEAEETPVDADAAQETEETPDDAGAEIVMVDLSDDADEPSENAGNGAADKKEAEEDIPAPTDPGYRAWKERSAANDDQASLLAAEASIQNDYIRVIVRSNGDFVIYTVEGNPASDSDNNQRLLYDTSSHALIRIDGNDYTFGDYITDTTVSSDGNVCTSTAVIDGVTIKQIFTLEMNPFTQLADNVGIRYTCENTSDAPKEVGLQIKMDTMLGSNDRSPFYLNGEGFTTQVEFTGDDIPQNWQSFDQLENPTVIGSGTFILAGSEKPDKVQFGSYGSLVNSNYWDIQVSPGSSNGDSAVAIHFNPRTLEPGETRNVGTYYGVSGFSDEYENMNPPLGVKVMTPAFLFVEDEENKVYANNPFTINVYYTNNGGVNYSNLRAEISVDDTGRIRLADGQPTSVSIGPMSVDETRVLEWTLEALPQYYTATAAYTVRFYDGDTLVKTMPIGIMLSAFRRPHVTVTLQPENGEAASTLSVESGTAVGVLPAPERDGYAFVGWYTENDTAVTKETTVDSNVTFRAHWTNENVVTFKTRHTTTQAVVPNVILSFTNEQGQVSQYNTGDNGQLTISLPEGVYTVNVLADGYQKRAFLCEISGRRNEYTIYMNNHDIIEIETTVREMSREEIIAAGIDADAPENRHVYDCEAIFEFGVVHYIGNDTEVLSGEAQHFEGGKITVLPVAKDIFLIVHSQVNWLKEMFAVELRIKNTSDYERIENCVATLNLPDGLSLAAMTGMPQSLSHRFNMISLSASDSKTWYLAGDRAGSYTLNGTVSARRIGGGIREDFTVNFATSDPIEVLAGGAMKLDITAERYAILGKPYHVTYELTNTSTKNIYDVSMNVLGARFLEAYSVNDLSYQGESGPELSGSFNEGYVLHTDTFQPNETLTGVFTINFGEGLNVATPQGMMYALKDMFVTTGAGSTTEIPTELHVTDNLAFLLSCDPNGGTGSAVNAIMEKSGEETGTTITAPVCNFSGQPGQRFTGWEFNGAKYAPGAAIQVTDDSITEGVATLKAAWEYFDCAVSYDGNGGEGEMPSFTTSSGELVTLPECAFTPPEFKRFKAWNISGQEYAPGAEYRFTSDVSIQAVWEDITYTVTYDASGAEGEMPDDTAVINQPFTLPQNAFTVPEFQFFKAWQIDEEEFAPGYAYTFTDDTTVKAVWETITYAVTYDANNGTDETQSATATAGQPFTLPQNAFTAPQFQRFKAWQIGEDEYPEGAEYTFTANATVKALWEDITYVVTYDANGGTETMEPGTAVINQPFALPECGFTPPQFQKFKAWQIGEDEYAPGDTYTFTDDTTVKAVWETITYAVTYDANGGTETMESATATAGQPFTLPQNGFTAPQFQRFKAWGIGEDEFAPDDTYTFTDNTTVKAVWEYIPYAVTYDKNGGTGDMNADTVTAAQAFALPECGFTPPQFQKFKAWQIGEDEYAPGDTYTFTDNATVKALWEDITYVVTYDANGGTETMESATATAGQPFTLPQNAFTAPQFHVFKAWQIGEDEFAPDDTYTFTDNTTVKAVWERVAYVVTYDANDGAGEMDASAAPAGQPFALPECAFTAPDGFEFKAWQIGEDEYAPGDTYTFDADTTVNALWIPLLKVTFYATEDSELSSQLVRRNSNVTPPSTPTRTGYTFSAWYRDAELTQLYDFAAPVEADTNLYAKWSPQGCYVATAVYGSYDCPEVWTLRRFRDKVLAKTWYGRLFIRLYYAVSPTAVRLFGDCAWFQNFFRGKLDKLVSGLQSDGFECTPYQDLNW